MDKRREKIDGLLSLLSVEATKESRDLLKKHGRPDAKNYKDLETKLAELFYACDDKKALEKELCEIHPHRNFILRYVEKPAPKETKIEAPNGVAMTPDSIKEILREYISSNSENFSNCAGNPNCNCGSSSFTGGQATAAPSQINNTHMLMGVLGVVAIVGLLVYSKK
jgi:hypothetical protein